MLLDKNILYLLEYYVKVAGLVINLNPHHSDDISSTLVMVKHHQY